MSGFLTGWAPSRRTRRVLGTTSVALAVLALAGPPASAATGDARIEVVAATPTTVSLVATGFTPSSTVRFRMTVGICSGEVSSVVGAVFPVEFDVAPACSGPATAEATSDTQSASTSFAFGTSPARTSTVPAPADPSAPPAAPAESGQSAGLRTVASRCTVTVTGGDVPAVKAGDTVCFSGALPARLEIRSGGTDSAPVTYSGMGSATVPGITARGDHIVIEGFASKGADDNGVYVSGDNITVQDNDISQVSITDDDVDAIRFFGDDITIAHNYAHDIWANPGAGGDPHTDCMQTYAHSEPASSNVVIQGNRCASPQFHQCLMAEGPNDVEDGASGVGTSANWTITNNYFECHAEAQTIALQDIHNVTFTKNDFQGSGSKAIALQKDATGATVAPDNTKGSGYGELVGIDDDSARQGYRGPGG